VAWNGQLWVAGGGGNSTNFAWSDDGKSWTASTSIPFGTSGSVYSVAWNGQLWVTGGGGGSINFAWSTDGKIWTASTSIPFGTIDHYVQTVVFNSARPNTITFNNSETGSITPSNLNISLSTGDQLDVVCDSYYNLGFTNFSISIDN
jgi:hypothetical protein